MISVVNIKFKNKYDIYCGRFNQSYNLPESKWANPFIIGKDGNREEVIEKYRLWINSQPNLLQSLPELKDKILSCWCVPEDCHCFILKELAESKYIRNWFSNMLKLDEPLIYQDITYNTVENFYQAMKIPKNLLSLRKEISIMTPFEAKKEIRDKVRFTWDVLWTKEKALKVMEYALKWKFKIGTDWNRKLMITKELNLELVEWNNWGDKFYGKDIVSREGENNLGKLLMKIRNYE